jgi:hypothetical protein
MTSGTSALPIGRSETSSRSEGVLAARWPLYAVLGASLGIVVGLIWDISWHRSIGRDTFWSPPHVLEQLSAMVAGLSCGWVVLNTTFRGTAADHAASVRFWGFRGPLGAWLCIWGTLTMLASAPLDNWWHNAYGLDVKIMSPPHFVLSWGMVGIQAGAILMALARQNRATPDESRRLGLLYALSSGILLTMHGTGIMEFAAFPNDMRGPAFYRVTALLMPVILVATARPSRLRWPATTTSAIYAAIVMVLIWILPLFPATAKLAPIHNPVTHMIPPPFPLLVVVPAFAIDLLMRRTRLNDSILALCIGVSYVALMIGVHWWWGEFLLSPAARNAFFGVDNWDYYLRLGDWRYQFWTQTDTAPFLRGIAIAVASAIVTSRIGLWVGSGMASVRR